MGQSCSRHRYALWQRLIAFAWLVTLLPLTGQSFAEPAPSTETSVNTSQQPPALHGFRSRHYVIYTNLTREETQPYGRHMDKVADQYLKRFAKFVPNDSDPMPLYLLRTREEYVRFLAKHNIDATNSGGMFFVTHSAQGLATWAESANRQKTYRILQHEGFHQFAWTHVGPRLPVWVNEGLAQYFEDAVMVDGAMELGFANQSRINRVTQAREGHTLRPIDELLKIDREQWVDTLRNSPKDSALYYAQSWSLVYFLIHGKDGAYKEKLVDYLRLINQGIAPQQAEVLCFGTGGIASLAGEWKRFAAGQRSDDLTAATDRLEFLGTGLRMLDEHDREMPRSIADLQDELKRMGFRLRKRELGISRDQSAEDEELFRFVRDSESGNGFEAEFRMLAPSRRDLPPRIVAPGLSPEPTLVWYRDSEGNLVQDIEYR